MEEEKETKETEQPVVEKIDEEVDKAIKKSIEQGVQISNIDYLMKMVDIKKDISQIKKEEENMMYREGGSFSAGGYGAGSYGEYSEGGSYGRRGVPGSGRGRYSEGSYGRRGVKGTGRGRYRGEEMMDEMKYHYGNYSEGGQYGAEGETVQALEYMMEATVEFIKMLKEEAKSPEEMQIIKHYSKKISEM